MGGIVFFLFNSNCYFREKLQEIVDKPKIEQMSVSNNKLLLRKPVKFSKENVKSK